MESCRTVRQDSSSLSSMVNGEEEGGGGAGKEDTPDLNEGNERTTPKKESLSLLFS